ncbi:hypothetical protein I4U23_004979 [Adineta vaga]|nr:hypothetical protein I4U23_004979 [Adineta vaga]
MSKQPTSEFYRACRDGDTDTVEKMLPILTKEDIERVEPNGSTALHAATHYGHKKIVKLLLARSPDTSIRNTYGNTAEDEASGSEIRTLFKQSSSHASTIYNKDESCTQGSKVFVFKNGYCLIVKRIELPPNRAETSLEINDLPTNPVHGTFSIQTSANVTVSSIRIKNTHREMIKTCMNTEELIKANWNQENIEILVEGLQSSPLWIKGKIQSSSVDQNENDCEDKEKETPIMVVIKKTDNRTIAIPLKSIISIQGENLETTLTQEPAKKSLRIFYKNGSDSNGWAVMRYLTFGIAWVPSYDIILMKSKKSNTKMLRLSMKCVLMNDIEDLQAASLVCIVGHPNLSKYINVTDAVFSDKSAKDFLKEMAQCEHSSSSRSSSLWLPTQNCAGTRFYQSTNDSKSDDTSFDEENKDVEDKDNESNGSDDLYLYEFHNILLDRKEKILLSVFNIETPYKDLYQCKIDQTQRSPNDFKSVDGSGESMVDVEVWHAIEFDNKSKHTLTTAPVMVTQDDQQFICQDSLPFTMKNQSALIALTKAPSIRVKYEEKGSDSQLTNPSTVVIVKKKYVKEEWNGSLTVINTKNEPVIVVIRLRVCGQMSKYSLAPKFDNVRDGQFARNKIHDIRWDVSLEPQQQQIISYCRNVLK